MQTFWTPILCIVLITIPAFVSLTSAEESYRFQKLPLTANDIAGVTGLNIYKYRIAMQPGTRFDVAVSVQDAPDAKPRFVSRNEFTSDDDVDGVDLLLSFLSRDNTLRGVLLSQDEEISYRVDCPRCSPAGIATNISLPLNDVPGTRKTLMLVTADQSAKLTGENEICLIAILATQDGKPASIQKSYPRAKVSIVFPD